MNGLKGTIVNPEAIYGKSAYEIAVINGFEGTEAEWLESLKGSIEQTYNPTSPNAQSGIAVAEAIAEVETEVQAVTEMVENINLDITEANQKTSISENKDTLNIVDVSNVISRDATLWENGSISAGVNYNDGTTIRVRSTGYFDIKPNSNYKVNINTNYKTTVSLFDENYQFINVANNITYLFNGDVFNSLNAKYVRIVIAENNNAVITATSVAECGLTITQAEAATDNISLRQGFKKSIKIMTFNIGLFYNGVSKCPDDYVETHKNTFKQLFAKYQPDFIFTQESPLYCNASNNIEGKTFFKNRYVNYLGTTDGLGKQFITNSNLFGYSHHSFSNERDYIKAYTYINEIKVALYNAHLSLTPESRAVQIAEIIADMQTEEYVILGFDSNVATSDELQPFVNAGFKLGNGGVLGNISTYVNSDRIVDNVIVSSNITLCKAEAETELFEEFADHRPFILTIEVGVNTVDEPTENGTYNITLVVKDGVKTYKFTKVE